MNTMPAPHWDDVNDARPGGLSKVTKSLAAIGQRAKHVWFWTCSGLLLTDPMAIAELCDAKERRPELAGLPWFQAMHDWVAKGG